MFYFVGNVLSKIVIFLLLPLYTKYISPSSFGYFDLMSTYINLAIPVLSVSIWVAMMRFMFDHKNDCDKIVSVVNGTLIFVSSLAVYSIVFFVAAIMMEIEYAFYVYLYGLIFALTHHYSHLARGYQHNFLFALSGLIGTIITVVCNVLLIIGFDMDYKALYISWCIGNLLQVIMLESRVRLVANFNFKHVNSALLLQMARYAFPYSINSVFWWILTGYNRVVIANALDVEQNGIYSVATKFSLALNLIAASVSLAWQEAAFKKGGNGENDGFYYSHAADLYIRFLMLGTVLLLPFVYLVFPILIDETYKEARVLIPLNILGTVVGIYAQFQGSIYGAIKQTRAIFYSTLISGLINVGLIWILIFPYGPQAANISMLIGFLVNVIIRSVILNTYMSYRVDYQFLFLLLVPLVIISMYFFIYAGWAWNLSWMLLVASCLLYQYKSVIIRLSQRVMPE